MQTWTTNQSSKKLHSSFVPNLTVNICKLSAYISGGKFAAICCITFMHALLAIVFRSSCPFHVNKTTMPYWGHALYTVSV